MSISRRTTPHLIGLGELEEELVIAREIQFSILPDSMPQVPGYDLAGILRPANHTGGDMFDLVNLDQGLFVLLGDATGHGAGPAMSVTQMQAMLRVAFRLGAGLDEAYQHTNNQLAEDLPEDRFVTAFMGFLDPATHEMTYHSAGQGPILHYHRGADQCDWHEPTTFPLGSIEVESVGSHHSLALAPGDIMALISDGVYEFGNAAGQLFGQEGVARVLRENLDRSMAETGQSMLDELARFGDDSSQEDDITIVLIRRDIED
ncbi:MAG: PP2C family protein-serine/threonine phosphatase [Halioglobus sp.]